MYRYLGFGKCRWIGGKILINIRKENIYISKTYVRMDKQRNIHYPDTHTHDHMQKCVCVCIQLYTYLPHTHTYIYIYLIWKERQRGRGRERERDRERERETERERDRCRWMGASMVALTELERPPQENNSQVLQKRVQHKAKFLEPVHLGGPHGDFHAE